MNPRIRTAASLKRRQNVLWATGLRRGDGTGWASVDELFTVVPGQLTLITGWPNSGKSEWLDALILALLGQLWRIAYYSPENLPIEQHLSKLSEKSVGKPFAPGPTERMTHDEADAAADYFGDRVMFIEHDEMEPDAAETVLGIASEYFEQWPGEEKRALVIDPWNELEHGRPSNMTETEYISLTLGVIRRWARASNVHVFIVAHPAKQRREDSKLPTVRPDMVSGSQHWWNKSDNCITVERDMEDSSAPVKIHVQKVRFKHVGRIGVAELNYDRPTGRYFEPKRDGGGRMYEFSYGGKP